MKIPIEISGRHVHLSREHLDVLFGQGYELKKMKELSQETDFAAEETVAVVVWENILANVRIIGPIRNQTQVEVSLTDGFRLGIKIPVRKSGDLHDTPGAKLIGPKGTVGIDFGVIASWRHIHMSPEEAEKSGFKNSDLVSVKIGGDRGLIFDNTMIRVKEGYSLMMQIDTDEANASWIPKGGEGEIIRF